MSTSVTHFTHEFISARKRYNFGMVEDESDASGTSLESLGGDEIPLLSGNYITSAFVTPIEVLSRLCFSLLPPLHPARIVAKPPVDPIGPVFVVTFLISFLIHASSKTPPFEYHIFGPITIMLSYIVLSSLIVFSLGNLFSQGRFPISLLQIVALIGYSLFGHLLSLGISYSLYKYPEPPNETILSISGKGRLTGGSSLIHGASSVSSQVVDYEEVNSFLSSNEEIGSNNGDSELSSWGDKAFLICLVLVTGPATLRIVLILLSPIQSPPGRMVLGTILCLSHLLLLVVLHATFLHPTFQYGAKG